MVDRMEEKLDAILQIQVLDEWLVTLSQGIVAIKG